MPTSTSLALKWTSSFWFSLEIAAWLKLCTYKLSGGHSSGACLPCLRSFEHCTMWFYAALPKGDQDTQPNHEGRSGERTSLAPPRPSHQTSVTNTSLPATCRSVPKTFKSESHGLILYFDCLCGKIQRLSRSQAGGERQWPCRSHCGHGHGDATTTLGKASGAAPGKWPPGKICLYY